MLPCKVRKAGSLAGRSKASQFLYKARKQLDPNSPAYHTSHRVLIYIVLVYVGGKEARETRGFGEEHLASCILLLGRAPTRTRTWANVSH